MKNPSALQQAAKPATPLREHTHCANTPTFRDTVPTVTLLVQLPMRFGRITHESNPTELVSPSPPLTCPVPPEAAGREVPALDHVYCARSRRRLRTALALSAPRRFPPPDVQAAEVLGLCFIDYEPRLHACGSTLLREAPYLGAITGLSYASAPGFPWCQACARFPLAALTSRDVLGSHPARQ